jgi:DNA-binding NarL/FixJ family response regulator
MNSGTLSRTAITTVHEDHVTSVYRYATRAAGIADVSEVALELGLATEDVRRAVDQLIESHLLQERRDGGPLLVPVDPEVAAVLLVSPMEREIHQRRQLIAQARERIEMFREVYAAAAPPAPVGNGVERVAGSLGVSGYLKMAGDTCDSEVLVLQPSRQDPAEFDEFLQVCVRLLERGVSVRILGQHRSLADLSTRMKIRRVTVAGADIRTVSNVPRAAVVFDRSLAVLLGGADGQNMASRVRDEHLVGFLMDLFNDLWDAATPLESVESGYAEVADDLQRAIAGLMAKGFTDEALARKLGMSVRTCRRHIATLMRELEAVSRFQAGVHAARRQFPGAA